MCGGTIEFEQGDSVGVCDSCGTKQTLPKLDDDRRINLYDRANHFRRNNEFDKAAGIYEQILNEDNTDAEAYWSIVLCRYGIEYVEDPSSHKRVPTVNRAQFTSIFDDEDYRSALLYADSYQKSIYEDEAAAINEIQKGILAISQKEEPFDVFICYKETDQNGRRTQDSVLANDLYHQLTQEGFKVFFSRITLEDKLGTAYEPYIFAALNSAKVMVVLGTRPEYFNAVWVKNEWSRYLALVKASKGEKVLIPAYRDMDPYDLPEEFSHLQAQDMSKLGFMQDLIRGIKKLTKTEETKIPEVVTKSESQGNSNMAALIRRAFIFLEDGDWDKADDYCEQVLNMEPENAQAYLGKLMADLHVNRKEQLCELEELFDNNSNYQKIMRFGNEEIKLWLDNNARIIKEKKEEKAKNDKYVRAQNAMKIARSETAFIAAADQFQSIAGFKDSDNLATECKNLAEEYRKNSIYDSAISRMRGSRIDDMESAIEVFRSVLGWKDAEQQIELCKQRIEEIKAKNEADRIEKERIEEERKLLIEKTKRKQKRNKTVAIVSLSILSIVMLLLIFVIIPKRKYKKAMEYLGTENYEEAYSILESLGEEDIIIANKRDRATSLMEKGQFDLAYSLFDEIGDYETINESRYERAISYINEKDYVRARDLLCYLDNYKDSVSIKNEIEPLYGLITAREGSTIKLGSYGEPKENLLWIVLKKEDKKLLLLSYKAVDCKQFDNNPENALWESCELREWLNGDFLEETFNVQEREKILLSDVKTMNLRTLETNNSRDYVFLLSKDEVEQYLKEESSRKCYPTQYAISRGATLNNDSSYYSQPCLWWTRTINDAYIDGNLLDPSDENGIIYVNFVGAIQTACCDLPNRKGICVRPAMWVLIPESIDE